MKQSIQAMHIDGGQRGSLLVERDGRKEQAQMCAEGCEGVHFSKFFSKQAFGQISFGC